MIEQIQKRQRNSKTFLLDNGKYKTKFHMTNIHCLKKGKYEDIETDFEYEEGFGKAQSVLDSAKDWCPECAQKECASLARSLWDLLKAKRKPN